LIWLALFRRRKAKSPVDEDWAFFILVPLTGIELVTFALRIRKLL